MSAAMREPLVLIPGLGCSALLYQAQIPALWPQAAVQVANHTRGATMDEIAGAILADAPPRFALAGLSMGGYLAFAIMRLAPERVTRLALLDTAATADTPEVTERRLAAIAMAEADNLDGVVNASWPQAVHADRVGDMALKSVYRAMYDQVSLPAYARQQRAIMGRPDSRPGLAAIRCPTLVLVGDGDRLTPPERAEEIHAGIAGSRLVVVPGCGHISTLEQPDAVNAALRDWLAD
ncbi:alpha/beta hydrolase [Camelimonas fluminis]|uniref:Alpha/beta fold hydrolase n=1 Tax=Camelimonas fluminis TaxID=1576911 RepID=A0ABV7UJY4_9HYPH|nr:alpha/beta fold hydrolase [Camelimonas fluminis]GHE67813.1 alpha/beta hydrolase [Camelimonas fluminis]